MNEEIFNTIKSMSGKVTFKALSKKFDIDTEKLQNILKELKLDGKILQLGNKYIVFPKELKLGTIAVSTSGRKYLYYNKEKIYIASNFLNEVILHDIVSFKLNENNEAEIVTVVDRTLGKMTCEIMEIDGKKKVVPYHSEIQIILPNEIMDDLYVGDIILVEVTPNELFDYCDSKFIKKIGRKDDPKNEDIIIALNYGFDNDYSSEYLEEVKKYPTEIHENELTDRKDYRYQNSVTIDGINTKDMDDGVYAERLDNGNIRLYVHIADVSHYVKKDSLVFTRACEKTTSLYLNNSVFHMLHYIISNGICSLNPNVDRLTKTVIMDIDESGYIVDFDIVKSVINSKKKMNYDDVDEILLNNNVPLGYENHVSLLLTLNDAANRLEKRYTQNGKINFANNESECTYNSDGSIKDMKVITNSPARKLIENLMIAANETLANWFYNMGIPTVYRVHELPDIDKVNALIDKLNKSGIKIKHLNNVDNTRIQIMLDKLRNSEIFGIISQAMVMSMQRAGYSTENYGHYGLGLDAYLHFTSPIRRLADLLVHMMCDLIIDEYYKLTNEYLDKIHKELSELAKNASRMQRQADMAEIEATRRLKIKELEKYIGEEFEATICETDEKIRIKFYDIDVYIDKRSLGDNFLYDSKKKLYYDKYSGKYLTMGTKVSITLISANSSNRSVKLYINSTINQNIKKRILIS